MSKQEGVARISFSLPPQLAKDLDKVSEEMGFDERSKALQMAIRNLITEFKVARESDALAIGTFLILYNHEKKHIDGELTDIGHDFNKSVVSSLHVHLEDARCLNIIVAKGDVKTMAKMEERLRKVQGIIQLKFSYMLPELAGR